jgi:hypothetical protein
MKNIIGIMISNLLTIKDHITFLQRNEAGGASPPANYQLLLKDSPGSVREKTLFVLFDISKRLVGSIKIHTFTHKYHG